MFYYFEFASWRRCLRRVARVPDPKGRRSLQRLLRLTIPLRAAGHAICFFLDGILFPGLWRVKVKHPRSTRLILLGVREEVRKNVKRYGGLSAAMYVEVARRGVAKGYEWGELSWTREDDAPINLGIRAMGAKIYKRYRMFEKTV